MSVASVVEAMLNTDLAGTFFHPAKVFATLLLVDDKKELVVVVAISSLLSLLVDMGVSSIFLERSMNESWFASACNAFVSLKIRGAPFPIEKVWIYVP